MPRREHAEAAIAERARDWVVRLLAEGASSAERVECAQWRAADLRHEAAFLRAESLWMKLGNWRELGGLEPLESGYDKTYWVATAAAAALVAVLAFWYLQQRTSLPQSQLSTQIAEIRDVTLADGSVVTLGAHSKIKLAFSESERRVKLTGGDAFFSVKADPDKPFLVEAGETLVRVIGTKFDVRRSKDQVRVSVLEGVVQVLDASKEGEAQALTAGQEVVAARGRIEPVHVVDAAKPGAWRNGRLIYVDASLAEVVADANRYFDKRIELESPQLAGLRLTTAFRADQIDEMLDTLARTLPVSADRSEPGTIRLRAAARAQ
jgi:transmembrane sensor